MVTDHHSLCYLLKKRDLTGRLARWALTLQDHSIEIVHKSGRLHADADALSRQPLGAPEDEPEIPTLILAPTAAEFVAKQAEDPVFAKVLQSLAGMTNSRREAKNVQQYIIKDGKLYRQIIINGRSKLQLCLPKPYVDGVLRACHDHLTAGHLGTSRTLHRVAQRYYWPRMLTDAKRYVRTCHDCQMRKGSVTKPVGFLKSIKVTQPFERVGLDILGPFPRSSLGNRYAIMAIDYFSKFVIARAVPVATSEMVIEFLVEGVVLHHGTPRIVTTDRGKPLTSNLSQKLFQALQVQHAMTTSYHSQSDGLIERFNRTVAQTLSFYVSTKQDNWDRVLKFAVFGYNTSKQETTGYTPFFLTFAREPVLPVDVALDNRFNETDALRGVTGMPALISKIQVVREEVRRRIKTAQARQRRIYNEKRIPARYDPGDLVLLFTPVRRKGRSEKLLFRYWGPYRIVKGINNLNYVVGRNGKDFRMHQVVHVSRMKRFHSRRERVRPCEEMSMPAFQ